MSTRISIVSISVGSNEFVFFSAHSCDYASTYTWYSVEDYELYETAYVCISLLVNIYPSWLLSKLISTRMKTSMAANRSLPLIFNRNSYTQVLLYISHVKVPSSKGCILESTALL